MKAGRLTLLLPRRIDYKQLSKVNPEAARFAVLGYLKTNNHNISQTAQIFGINRAVVYNILRKENEGDLKDHPRTPHHQHKRTTFCSGGQGDGDQEQDQAWARKIISLSDYIRRSGFALLAGRAHFYVWELLLLRCSSTFAINSLGLRGFRIYSQTSNGKGCPSDSEKLVSARTGVFASDGSLLN